VRALLGPEYARAVEFDDVEDADLIAMLAEGVDHIADGNVVKRRQLHAEYGDRRPRPSATGEIGGYGVESTAWAIASSSG
jgi:hypothetical protein